MSQGNRELIVIGNGMAGAGTLQEIVQAKDRPNITVFGGEPHVNYNRILLSDVLACSKTPSEIFLNTRQWYEDHGIRLHTGVFVVDLHPEDHTVTIETGQRFRYDQLLLATGSLPYLPPIPGIDKQGVFTFRNLDDTESMIRWSSQYEHAVIVGGGLLGLEAARGLTNRGMVVNVVHLMGHLMEQQVDLQAGTILKSEIEEMGIGVHLNCTVSEIGGDDQVEWVRLSTGEILDADLVLLTAGIRPNVKIAKEAGLAVQRGILVDDYMRASRAEVYAVGECIEHRGRTYGLVAPIMEQARVAARSILGKLDDPYEGSVSSTSLKVAGIELTSMGQFQDEGSHTESLIYADVRSAIYKKVVIQKDRVIGAIFMGDSSDRSRILDLIKKKEDISSLRHSLLLGTSQVDSSGSLTSEMSDEETICGCMGVTKGTILEAVERHQLDSREGIAEKTRACTSCKGCAPLVDQILRDVLGGSYASTTKAPFLCSCQEMTREAMRDVIQESELKTYTEVKKSGCIGDCGLCKPGVSYLLSEVWPRHFTDERHARFINDRVHANIQKDGSFSVVPRIYGGVTSPDQLRKIADVADKYQVPMLKITGGQRLDLLGVKKEDLPRIWEELDMPSGHAYAKAVRTVKTCVGAEFCRFGVGDSTALGIEMEQCFEGLYTPHKVKMSVSGCPRNCAESYVKDIGVVAIEGGWEIYVGGAAGMKVRKGDLLCRVETPEEALKAATLFLQFYREEGEYLERTYDFVERLGIEAIRRELFEPTGSNAERLLARFKEAKSAVVDPWKKEGPRPVHHRQFTNLGPAAAKEG